MSSPSNLKGLENGRAAFAYERVQEAKADTDSKEYRAYTRRLPMLIKTNGLGNALAFEYAKGSNQAPNAHDLLLKHLTDWFRLPQNEYLLGKLGKQPDALLLKVIKTDSATYRSVTTEVLALLHWLRRLAEGAIEKK